MTTTAISVPRTTFRAATRQARIDLRTNLLTGTGVFYLLGPVVVIVMMVVLRNVSVMDSQITLAQTFLPGMLALSVIAGCVTGLASELMMEREDGTLLRMKAVPHGMPGFLLGKTLTQLLLNLIVLFLMLIPAAIFFPSVAPASFAGWMAMTGILILGVAAMMPLGALMGALMRNMMQLSIATLGTYGLAAISGVFYPQAALPGWLQVIGQIFPMYWLGLGFRQVLLPAEAAMLEIGGTWRTVEMLIVLGIWTLIGLLGAPRALRRMIRGVSGSKIVEARERVLSRGY